MKKLLITFLMVPAVGLFAQQRVPLFEMFTSSTCGPCKPGNQVLQGVLTPKPTGEYVSVKFQASFPGNGDPYNTAETHSRRQSYYSINSVPRLEIDGGYNKNPNPSSANPTGFTTVDYDAARSVTAKYYLTGVYTFDDTRKIITAKVDYHPATAAAGVAGAKLHVVIIESETKNNVKSNGETEFYNVVKKMLPNQNGTTLAALSVGSNNTTTLSFEFKGNYRLPANGQSASYIDHATEHSVEDFSNLKVVAWIQGADKEVYQAANLLKVNSLSVNDVTHTMTEVNVFPNPASATVNINLNLASADNITALIVDLEGKVVVQKSIHMKAGKNQLTIDTHNIVPGLYNVIVLDSKSNSHTAKLAVVH